VPSFPSAWTLALDAIHVLPTMTLHQTGGLWAGVAAFVLAVIGAGLALLYIRRAGMFDVPNQRSSHTTPTPRGGGIAVVGAVLLVGAGTLHAEKKLSSVFLALIAAVIGLTVLGWLDDRGSIRVRIRLIVHALCGAAVALLVNAIAPVPWPVNLAWLALWVFWSVASINIVNFMDGVDGMIAAQGVVYGVFLFALLPESAAAAHFGLILAGACLGFLVWNWAPAKMFMGDSGSGPLGLFFVIGGALALQDARPALVFLPLFPLFLDALLTILIRMRRGEKLTDAHRTHLYQRLANGGWGHAPVTSVYALGACVAAVVALLVKNASPLAMITAIAAYVLLALLGWKMLHDRFLESDLVGAPDSSQPPLATNFKSPKPS
jgi:UDP-N-acetylmuramyl pentapeptide phosphotransferase/UDP-N-acetylglucosamine-1-phosphate transferase